MRHPIDRDERCDTPIITADKMPMDTLHRILSGQSLTPGQLRGAGIFVLSWWAMDLIQFADFVWSKF